MAPASFDCRRAALRYLPPRHPPRDNVVLSSRQRLKRGVAQTDGIACRCQAPLREGTVSGSCVAEEPEITSNQSWAKDLSCRVAVRSAKLSWPRNRRLDLWKCGRDIEALEVVCRRLPGHPPLRPAGTTSPARSAASGTCSGARCAWCPGTSRRRCTSPGSARACRDSTGISTMVGRPL